MWSSTVNVCENCASYHLDRTLFLLTASLFLIEIILEFLCSFPGIVGRISPKTWAAMEVFLQSIATEEYESMASALIEMGAANQNVDANAFARDLEKIFSTIQVGYNCLFL